jgi:monomeric sarcosine oxidase
LVLGIDQFEHAHNRGSSHGQTRAIRMAYFEHPDYVPLLRRAYELWNQLEAASGETLFHQVGLLEVGPADGIVVPGVLQSARQHNLPVDELTRDEVEQRFSGFVMPEDALAVFEQNAGFLRVEDCVLAHLREASRLGATFLTGERVESWSTPTDDSVIVKTSSGVHHAGRLVIAAGAWASQLLSELNISLQVMRKHLHWFRAKDDRYRLEQGTPTFFFELPDRSFFYGFPQMNDRGVKVAEHGHGELVADPGAVNRDVDPAERARVENFVAAYLPGVTLQATRHCVCMYTMTPDEHFIVDRCPNHPQVCFAAGLSGHGFKFAPVLGQALADLSLKGTTDLPIDFLTSSR